MYGAKCCQRKIKVNPLNPRPRYIGVNIRPRLHETPIYRGLGGVNKLLHRTHGFDDVGGWLRIEKWQPPWQSFLMGFD